MNLSLLKSLNLEIIREAKRRKKAQSNFFEFFKQTHPTYVTNWFHDHLCSELEQFIKDIEEDKQPRLILTVPPRHGKSTAASETLPPWVLGKHPNWQIILSSYSAVLAEKFSRRARDLARDPLMEQVFQGFALSSDRQGVEEWETKDKGVFKAIGVGGSATGSGANLFIIDDPFKDDKQARSELYRENLKEWYQSVATTRLMEKAGVLVIQTRWHEDDLVGWLLKTEPEKWKVVDFPAIAEKDEYINGELVRRAGEALHEERFSLKRLEELRNRYPRMFQALYQQKPSMDEGNIINRKWWRFYSQTPKAFDKVIISVDATFKETKDSDFVVLQSWGKIGSNAFLLEQIRRKMDFVTTLKTFESFYQRTKERFPILSKSLIEDKANGPAVISALKDKIPGIIPIDPKDSKEARLHAVSHLIEAGNIHLPLGWDGLETYIHEFSVFPNGSNDDQVDATTQALNELYGGRSKIVFACM